MPDISNGEDADFFFIQKEEAEDVAAEIVKLVKNNLPKYYKTPSSMIQVLTPMQRGVVGATNLNLALQEALNPTGEGLRRSGSVFRAGDKVMQIRNNYDKEVFNGDIGMVTSIDLEDRSLIVDFDDRQTQYDVTELDEIVHAYATTIHKAQGSEYQIVVMPILMNHYVMLQRNLIYTGITRAKKILVMVGTKRALAYAVNNVTVTKRNTLLKERLAGNSSNFMEESKVISYLDVMETMIVEPSRDLSRGKSREQSREQNLRVAEESSYGTGDEPQ
jgi:exodeoxyribonuclease V alpha subunit